MAAHICAASEGGPRYDANMTVEERRSTENGIWLCQSCSKLIDSDISKFTVEKLNEWKEKSERMSLKDLECQNISDRKQRFTLIINSFLDINENAKADEIIEINMTNFFDGRFLKPEYTWETIVQEMKKNIHLRLKKECKYFVRFTAHFSVAFIAGRILNPKSGIEVIPEQRTNNGIEVWDTKKQKGNEYEKLSLKIECLDKKSCNIAFALSITRNIEREVVNYINDKKLSIGKICFCSFAMPSIDSIVDGKHAWEISKQISHWIEENLIDRKEELHIYIAAPVSIMFNLGKMSLSYGRGQIYDYMLENGKSGTYFPALYFSERDWI